MFFKFISKGKQNSKCKNNYINNGVTNDLNRSKKPCKIALYGKKRGERRGRGGTQEIEVPYLLVLTTRHKTKKAHMASIYEGKGVYQ